MDLTGEEFPTQSCERRRLCVEISLHRCNASLSSSSRTLRACTYLALPAISALQCASCVADLVSGSSIHGVSLRPKGERRVLLRGINDDVTQFTKGCEYLLTALASNTQFSQIERDLISHYCREILAQTQTLRNEVELPVNR